jgi:hypothetical protein
MKLLNNTKKQEMRATLNTFKIMSLIKNKDEVSKYQIEQDWRKHMYQQEN